MAKHTEGPWRVDGTKAFGAYGVWTDYPTHPGHDGAGYESQVCSLMPHDNDFPREERDANAALIAAAPDLLALLTEARKWMDGDVTGDPWEKEFTQRIDAALARAKGD